MQPFIYYIVSFIAGGIITYIFAKAQFDTPEFQEKAEALEKYKKIIEGERNELAIKQKNVLKMPELLTVI